MTEVEETIAERRRREARERYRRWLEKHPGRRAEQNREWKKANKAKVAESNRRYAKKNPDKIKAKWQQHQSKNRAECAAKSARYREKNKENVLARLREFFKTPAGLILRRAGEQRRRARKKGCVSAATTKQISELISSAKQCCYCAAEFGCEVTPTIDHVIPLSRGGPHTIENLAVCCRPCNSSKGASDVEVFKKTIAIGKFT